MICEGRYSHVMLDIELPKNKGSLFITSRSSNNQHCFFYLLQENDLIPNIGSNRQQIISSP
jgi:hypothetical protein